MSGLTLRFKAPATARINLDGITPAKLAALTSHEIGLINVGFDKAACRSAMPSIFMAPRAKR